MAEAKRTTKKATKKEVAKTELTVETKPTESVEETQVVDTEAVEAKEQPKATKAGKRSPKALKEAEEKEAKEERKAAAQTTEAEAKPKKVQKPARSRLERRSKKYKEAAKLIDKTKTYSLQEAVELATKTSSVQFDAAVELHVRLGVDPKQADQNIRQTVVLPAGTGKTVRIAVVGEADDVAKSHKAGADIAGGEEFLQQLEKGEVNFDVLIATPTFMPKLGKYARLLGPKGLMPNPKSGTVTTNVAKAVEEAKAGKVEYRVDSAGIIHVSVGKVSFGPEKLLSNAQAIVGSIKAAKPASLKGNYVLSCFVTTTMGPSISVSPSDV